MDSTIEQIYKSAIKFLVPLTPDETYKLAVEEAKLLVVAEFGSVFLKDSKDLSRVYSTVPGAAQVVPRKNGNTERALQTNEIIVISSEEIERIYPQFAEFAIKSVVYVPLSYKKDVLGVLTLTSTSSGHFTSQKLRVLKLYGSLISLAIRNVQLYSNTQKALETRDAFIAMASHELKTPLTSIIGYTQLMQTRLKMGGQINPDWLVELDRESQRLLKLINEFLQTDYIKKSEIKHERKKYSLSNLLNEAIAAYGFRTGIGEIKVLTRGSFLNDQIYCDKDKLLTAFISLLSVIKKNFDAKKTINIIQKLTQNFWELTLSWQITPDEIEVLSSFDDKSNFNLEFVQKIINQHGGKFSIQSKNSMAEIKIALPKN